ncbi:MAG: hypothetical protein JNM24_04435 [Bdellovibrionaceae bacterium]|nr:hypothetical protein [Pseudobdellovibrionaceae bacterium]
MEDLAPPLELLLVVKSSIEKGKSIQDGIKRYLSTQSGHVFANQMFRSAEPRSFVAITRQWFLLIERQMATQELVAGVKSIYRRQLLQLLEKGIRKEPIYNQILILEHEIYQACEREIQEKLIKLPYLVMIPVLFFQFPALLTVIFGPLVQNFIESLR